MPRAVTSWAPAITRRDDQPPQHVDSSQPRGERPPGTYFPRPETREDASAMGYGDLAL